MVLGERGFYTAELYDEGWVKPLRPAALTGAEGLGRRLHDLAVGDRQHEIAGLLTFVFGEADCPRCNTGFSVADRVGTALDDLE